MDMSLLSKILLGAAIGAAGGFGLTRIRLCSGDACRSKLNIVYSILAGAVCGAGVAYALGR